MQSACKTYKLTMNKYINKYNKENESKLSNMHNKRPKDYWKFLNSIKSKKNIETPDLDTFYQYFQRINNPDPVNDNTPLNDYDHQDKETLNGPITSTEIDKCIRNLKNSKSPGIDNVLNEYIKKTKYLMLPFYTKLFNTVLDTVIIPNLWVEGIIIPLYKKGDPLNPEIFRPITLLSCMGKLFKLY